MSVIKTIVQNGNLKTHMSDCDKTLVKVAISTTNMKIHTKEKSFQWTFFDKKFNLKTHMSDCDKTVVKVTISTIQMRI